MTLLTYKKTIFATFLIIFACIGLGRFAFGMVLPNMQESLAISTTQIGLVSSANFLGYFLGIFLVPYAYNKFETYKLINVTLILQGLSMLSMTFFNDYKIISLFYFFSGLLAVIVNLSTMAYISNIIPKNIRGKALGIVVSGSGLAIMSSGIIVPYMESIALDISWRYSWASFSILVIIVALIVKPALKKHTKHHMDEQNSSLKSYIYNSDFWKITIIYIIFGITYIIYVTFFVSAVIDKYDFSTDISSYFWILLGFMSLFSGFIFGIIADKFSAFKALILVFLLQAIAHSILAFDLDSYAIWISAILYGITAWSIPSLVVLLSSIYFDVKKNAQVMSLLTILFAVAQIIGPIFAGVIKDTTFSFDFVFIMTSILCFIAVILSYIFSKQKA